jgi:glycerol-3-phosphate dehydrogenase (NAD(P)+)
MQRIGILGAGAWGTALAITARRAGRDVILQAREPEVARAITEDRENPLFLPGVTIASAIRVTTDPAAALDSDAILLAVPAQHLRSMLASVAARWPEAVPAVVCAKGIEQRTGALMTDVVGAMLRGGPVAVLSGPSFAIEVARDLPTAVTLASTQAGLRERLRQALGTPRFRIYSSDDVRGCELGGAVKNVLAIACGIVEGRGLGENARAALITRGLAEMMRLTLALGGRPETVMGLSGLGDLVLTCNGAQSRNFSLGMALGKGDALGHILDGRVSVAEGVYTAAAVVDLARSREVEMPICQAVDQVLNHGADLDGTIAKLLARPFRPEGWAD